MYTITVGDYSEGQSQSSWEDQLLSTVWRLWTCAKPWDSRKYPLHLFELSSNTVRFKFKNKCHEKKDDLTTIYRDASNISVHRQKLPIWTCPLLMCPRFKLKLLWEMPFLESLRLAYFKGFKFRYKAANKSTIIHRTAACIKSDMQPLKTPLNLRKQHPLSFLLSCFIQFFCVFSNAVIS